MDSFILLIFAPLFFGIFILIVQSLIDRSLKQFKNMEYDFKIKELESRIEKLEKINKEN
ncbi:hypothetical protein ACERII_21725 [Evansella sp. AB-rgal1]|uniref:hypothetical protein n=1 Tax=Evansella sp. AB-rgal1 TaxID=3242696 RepID=UPI00359ECF03